MFNSKPNKALVTCILFFLIFTINLDSQEGDEESLVGFCSSVVHKFLFLKSSTQNLFPTKTTFCFFQSTNIQPVQINNRFCLSKIMLFRLLPRRTAWGIMGMLFLQVFFCVLIHESENEVKGGASPKLQKSSSPKCLKQDIYC